MACYRSNGATKIRFVWVGGGLGRGVLRLTATTSVCRDLQPRTEGEFLQDVVDVPLHRVGGEVEALPDLLVAQPVRDQIEHGPLSRGHADRLDHVSVLAADRELCNVRKECGR